MYKLVNKQTGKIIAMANAMSKLLPVYKLCHNGEYSIERVKDERANAGTETKAA